MALPWHIPLSSISGVTVEHNDSKESSLLEYYCNLDIHKSPRDELETGLMCEIGTFNRDPAVIQRLIASGMTVARLNLRDLEPDACGQLIQSIRQAVLNYSTELDYVYPLALIIDVRGPDIVTGDLKEGQRGTVALLENQTIKLTTDASWRECGTADCLFIGYDHLTDLKPDDAIYIDSLNSGPIKLIITDVGDDSVECTIMNNGNIGPKMTARIFNVPFEINASNRQDSVESDLNNNFSVQPFEYIKDQISWAVSSDIDGIIIPNVKEVDDIHYVRDILSDKGRHILVFASIESLIGFDNIDSILKEADGVYVDRFVLCNDLPVEKIFIAQKILLAKCNEVGKPAIFKVVLNEETPTLCVTDIANMVLDGADVLALELHFEFPLKKYVPSFDGVRIAENCLVAAGVISRHAERISWPFNRTKILPTYLKDPSRSICVNAVELATRSRAVVIICLTSSGRTAKMMSHIKPTCPIVAVTRTCYTARQLRFWKGVRSLHYFEAPKHTWMLEVDARIHAALEYSKAKRILCAGEAYVIVSGSRKGAGYCDSVRLLFASAKDAVYVEQKSI